MVEISKEPDAAVTDIASPSAVPTLMQYYNIV